MATEAAPVTKPTCWPAGWWGGVGKFPQTHTGDVTESRPWGLLKNHSVVVQGTELASRVQGARASAASARSVPRDAWCFQVHAETFWFLEACHLCCPNSRALSALFW